MRSFVKLMWVLAQGACVGIVVLTMGLAFVLLWTGDLSSDRIGAAWNALRGKRPAPPLRVHGPAEEEWQRIEQTRTEMSETFRLREEELRNLQEASRMALAQAQRERERLEGARSKAVEAEAKAKREREELARVKFDRVAEAIVPIYERMKGQELASMMMTWEEKEIARTLRLLSSRKSAEVLRAMQSEPTARTKFDKVVAELQRVD